MRGPLAYIRDRALEDGNALRRRLGRPPKPGLPRGLRGDEGECPQARLIGGEARVCKTISTDAGGGRYVTYATRWQRLYTLLFDQGYYAEDHTPRVVTRGQRAAGVSEPDYARLPVEQLLTTGGHRTRDLPEGVEV